MPVRARRVALGAVLTLFVPFLVARPATAAPSPSPIVASDASLGFPDQDIHGGSNAQSENFTNSGGSDETVSSTAISGPDSADFKIGQDSCTGDTLAPSDSCSVEIDFAPGTAGAKVATLQLFDADGGEADTAVTGTAQTGTLSASTPNFQPQPSYYGDQQTGFQLSDSSSSWQVRGQSYSFTGPDASRFYVNGDFCLTSMFFSPGNSCFTNIGMHSADPGSYHASLVIDNDGTVNPVTLPLDVTELSGPRLSVASQAPLGRVAVGSEGAQQLTLTNTGDWPLPIAESIVVTGHPDVFFVSDDNCTNRQIDPAASCQMTVHFKPTTTGDQESSLFIITGTDRAPVTTVGLSGTGVSAPSGAANLTGAPAAGRRLSCDPVGYPAGTGFGYRWLHDGHATASAPSTRTLAVTDADVGARLACELTATTSGGTQTVRSGASAPVTPRDLGGLPGAFVRSESCRGVAAGRTLRAGAPVSLAYGNPVTTGDPLALRSRAAMRVGIDGETVDSGPGVQIAPAQLAQFGDGAHTLTVQAGGRTASERIVLAACRLGLRALGGDGRTSTITVSARAGVGALTIALPARLRLHVAERAMGLLSYRSAGARTRLVGLAGARSQSGGVVVSLTARGVRVTGLPPQTGVVGLSFRPGVLTGTAGNVRVAATLRGDARPSRASARSVWPG